MRSSRLLLLLLATAGLAAAACRTRSPRTPPSPPAPARHDAATVVIAGRAIPADLVRTHREREEFARRPSDDFWRSPALRIGVATGPIAVVYAYRTEARRPICMSSSTDASLRLLCLDSDARVRSVHRFEVRSDYRVLRPGAPYRFAIFVDGDVLGVDRWPRVGDVVTLPAAAWRDAEAEFAPIADPPPAVVEVGGERVTVEIAATRDARALGLMYRDRLPDGRGMLFLYGRAKDLSFWMLNTRIPLDVAYLDADGRIVSVAELTPLDLDGAASAAAARMALEVPGGWLRRHGVRVGDRVTIPLRVARLVERADS